MTPASLSSMPNSIQNKRELCEIIGAEVLAFLHPSDLECRSMSLRLVTKCGVQQYLPSHQVLTNLIYKCLNQWTRANIKVLLTQLIEQQLFPLIQQILAQSSIIMFCLNCFNSISNFIFMSGNMSEKMKPTGLVLCWPSELKSRSRSLEVVQNGRSQWCL